MQDQERSKEKLTGELYQLAHRSITDVIEFFPDAVFVIDKDKRVIAWNKALEEMTGCPKQKVLGTSDYSLPFYGEKRPIVVDMIASNDGQWESNYRYVERVKDCLFAEIFIPNFNGGKGAMLWIKAAPLYDEYGNIAGAIESIRDISAKKIAEEALRDSEEIYRAIFETTGSATVIIEEDTTISLANMEFEKITGYLKEEIEGKKSIVDFVHPAERDRIKQYNNARLSGRDCLPRNYESKLIDRDGNVKDVFITVGFIPFAKKIIVSLTDITLRKSAQKELENLYAELLKSHNKLKQLSLRDQQTGLYNHRYLEEILEAEFYRARRDAHPVSLIMIDIDYFKSINDVYGHSFGDLVIHQFASQLKLSVRKYDILIRFGGEEFIIISPNINKAKAVVMAQRLLDSVNLHNFGDKKNLIKIKLSISVTSYPEDKAVKSMDLVEVSARILDKAKEEGGNKVATIQDIAKSKRSSVLDIKKHTDIKSLQLNLVKLNKRANQNLIEAIFAFARTLELKDHYTGFHVEKTVTYATQIAKAMKLCDEEVSVIRQAAMLHDLGKIGVSEKILLKRSRLTKSEFQEIKKHPNIGADIIRPIQLLHAIVPLILYHHERWDGKGYPTGLKRDEIPIGARVIAVADVYQALTSDRPYRKALTKLKAMEIIRRGSGTQFDPNIVATFLKILSSERKK